MGGPWAGPVAECNHAIFVFEGWPLECTHGTRVHIVQATSLAACILAGLFTSWQEEMKDASCMPVTATFWSRLVAWVHAAIQILTSSSSKGTMVFWPA